MELRLIRKFHGACHRKGKRKRIGKRCIRAELFQRANFLFDELSIVKRIDIGGFFLKITVNIAA